MKSLLKIISEIDSQNKTIEVKHHTGISEIKKVVELGDIKIREIVKNSQNIQNELKANITQKLGQGSYGIAYLLSNNKVLKLTSDNNEALVSNQLIDTRNKHIVQIFNVVEVTLSEKSGGGKMFMIVEEKLNVNTEYNFQLLKELSQAIGKDLNKDFTISSTVSTIEELSLENRTRLINYINMLTKRYNLREDILKMVIHTSSALQYLKSVGIEWKDLHYGNIGKRNSDFVVFDFGLSKSSNPVGIKKSIEETII